MEAQKTQCFQGIEGTRIPAAKRPDEGFSLSQRRLRTRRSGVRIPYSVPKSGTPIRVARFLHIRERDSNHVRTCRRHVHEPVQTLANSFIVSSRLTHGKRRCMRIPYSVHSAQALETQGCRKGVFVAGIKGNKKTAKSFPVPINHFTMGKRRSARMKRSHHLARRPEKPVYGKKPTKNGRYLRRISSIRVT